MSLFSFIQVCAACLRLSNCLFLGLGTDQCRRPLKQTEFYTVYPPSFGIMTPLCLEISWMCFGFRIFLFVLLPEFSMNEFDMILYAFPCTVVVSFESGNICEWMYDLNYHWSKSVDIWVFWISVLFNFYGFLLLIYRIRVSTSWFLCDIYFYFHFNRLIILK